MRVCLAIGLGVLLFLGVAATAAAFVFVPTSVQIHVAGIANCNAPKIGIDSRFDVEEIAGRSLARVFRWKQWTFGERSVFSDSLSGGEITPLHLLIEAAASYKGQCDGEVLALFERYLQQGAAIDRYDANGYTPLHEAIVFGKVDFVRALVARGADTHLRVKSANKSLSGMSAFELADFLSKSPIGDHRGEIRLAIAAKS
jgi:hypothetical protein